MKQVADVRQIYLAEYMGLSAFKRLKFPFQERAYFFT